MNQTIAIGQVLFLLIVFAVGLGSLWVGWRSIRTLARPPLFDAMVWARTMLLKVLLGEEAAQRTKAQMLSPDGVRLHGYMWMYTGILGLIYGGVRLLRWVAVMVGQ